MVIALSALRIEQAHAARLKTYFKTFGLILLHRRYALMTGTDVLRHAILYHRVLSTGGIKFNYGSRLTRGCSGRAECG